MRGVTDLVAPTMTGVRSALFVRQARGGVVLDLSQPKAAVPVAKFIDDPWFAGAARIGRTFARLDAGHQRVKLLEVIRVFPNAR